jgi:uncharacterized protein (TIGR00290 family)
VLEEVRMQEKVLISWSGGKDSALALYELMKTSDCEVIALLTTVNEDYDRVSLHGVRSSLLEHQAGSLNLPIEKVMVYKDISEESYESKMREVLVRHQAKGVEAVVFGDVFLESVRDRRMEKLSQISMKAIFPLWGKSTNELAERFVELGFKAIIVFIDTHVLDKQFIGREYDQEFFAELPTDIDPCGENGEFHTFVYDGPIFSRPIQHELGEVVLREKRLLFCDLLPA